MPATSPYFVRPGVRLAMTLGVIWIMLAFSGPSRAEVDGDDINQLATAVLAATWNLTLDAAGTYIEKNDLTPDETDYFYDTVRRVLAETSVVEHTAETRIAEINQVLDVVGQRSQTTQGEHSLISEARNKLVLERLDQTNRLAIAVIIGDRAERMTRILESDEWIWSGLWTRSLSTPSISTAEEAVPAAVGIVLNIVRSPAVWLNGMDERPNLDEQTTLGAIGLVVVILFGWLVRRFATARCGRDPTISEPTYSRRFVAALTEGFAGGIVPAMVVGVFLYDLSRTEAIITGSFADALRGGGYAVTFLFLVFALVKGALSPEQTTWRITSLTPESARRLSWRCRLLAVVVAIDVFFSIAGNPINVNEALRTIETFTLNLIEGLILLSLTSPSVWQRETPADVEDEADGRRNRIASRMWLWIRRATVLIVSAGVAGSALGYLDLGSFLIKSTLATAVVASVLFLLREVLRETIALLTRSTLFRETLGASHRTRRTMKFWLRAVLDPVLAILMLFVLASIWGVPFDQLAKWTGQALEGFQVGNVQISLLDLAAGIGTFIVIIVATRVLQTILQDHILPDSGLDEGTQLSVLSVLSYLGFTMAAVLGIAVIGVDMTTIGLVAGGLSIGIGLGLQGIVNNFISGIILLIERPVKVGDWVIVGAHEGFVKRVSIRATEIETWRRASVIVPNAELLNTSVTNWTHHDRMGRMEIKVFVPRGADIERVQEILLECANKHPSVTQWPEPSALFMDFGENGLNFELRCFTDDNLWVFYIASDIRFAINKALREEGIEVPLPQRVVHMTRAPQAPMKPDDTSPA